MIALCQGYGSLTCVRPHVQSPNGNAPKRPAPDPTIGIDNLRILVSQSQIIKDNHENYDKISNKIKLNHSNKNKNYVETRTAYRYA